MTSPRELDGAQTTQQERYVRVPRKLTPMMRDVANCMANGGYDHANDFWAAMLDAARGIARVPAKPGPLDESCPTCKRMPGYPCDMALSTTPKDAMGRFHRSRVRKAEGRKQ